MKTRIKLCGIIALAALIGFSIVCPSLLLMSCGREDEVDNTPPVLSVPFIDVTKTVRFLAFGEPLREDVYNCTYEIHVNSNDAKVYSVSAGVIDRIASNATGKKPGDASQDDFEISVRPYKNSIYAIIYDHVRNLPARIAVGAKLAPGDELGTVGFRGVSEGRIELQINKNFDSSHAIALAPQQFGTPVFNDAMEQARLLSFEACGTPSAVCLMDTVIP